MISHCADVQYLNFKSGCRGCDRMVVEFTTTCAISTYHVERNIVESGIK